MISKLNFKTYYFAILSVYLKLFLNSIKYSIIEHLSDTYTNG